MGRQFESDIRLHCFGIQQLARTVMPKHKKSLHKNTKNPEVQQDTQAVGVAEDVTEQLDSGSSQSVPQVKVVNLMTRPVVAAALVILILVLGGVLFMISNNISSRKDNSQPRVVQTEQGIRIDFEKLEIARQSNERLRGLSYREQICDACGMLFVFPQEQMLTFWMKNTHVPLDIIFMNERGKVLKIHKNAEPDNVERRYSSPDPAMYVLEVKAGFADKIGLQEGQLVDVEYLKNQGVNFVWITVE